MSACASETGSICGMDCDLGLGVGYGQCRHMEAKTWPDAWREWLR
jgi:hypothetical protein